MNKYVLKNLARFLKEEKLIFILILLCSFVAAIVMYFAYGVGYNFITQKKIGETSSYEIKIQYNDLIKAKLEQDENYKNIALNKDYFLFSDLRKLLSEFDSGVYTNCSNIYTNIAYDTANTIVSFPAEGGMTIDNLSTIDLNFVYDKATGLFTITKIMEQNFNPYSYSYTLVDGEGFTNKSFIDEEKIAVVGVGIFNNLYVHGKNKTSLGYATSYDGEYTNISNPVIFINNDEYKISGLSFDNSISIPISSLEDNQEISTFFPELVTFCYDVPVTHEQYTQVKNIINENYGNVLSVKELEFESNDGSFYNIMIIIITLITFIVIINVAIMYRYILMKRRKQISIFRLCGCSANKVIWNFIYEALLIAIPSFILGTFVYFIFIKTYIAKYFIYIHSAYSVLIIALTFMFFTIVSVFVLLIMIYRFVAQLPVSVSMREE